MQAYPLKWPDGWPRKRYPEYSRFKVSFTSARDGILHEIKLLGGRDPIISTNIKLRIDGLPYAKFTQPDDQGVAVYFTLKKRQMVFACDRWRKIAENMQSIRKTIEALRGIERWGASDMMERAFDGFAALPAPSDWRSILVDSDDFETVRSVYIQKRSRHHPDKGGDPEEFHKITSAWDQARQELRA